MKNTKLSPKQRIVQLTLEFGISIRKLAKIAGMSEATLYKITDESRTISGRTATKICNQLKIQKGVSVNREWLLTGKGEMIQEQLQSISEETKAVEKPAEQDIDWCEKYYSLLEKYVKLLERRNEFIEKA